MEENVARLILTGFGPDARPDRQAYERVRRQLGEELAATRGAALFPDAALVAMAAIVLAVIVAVLRLAGTSGFSLPSHPWLMAPVAVATCNLVCLPIAAAAIVLKRKRHVF